MTEHKKDQGKGAQLLLVDNYDSFTFNLFQILAELTGLEPIVVPCDYSRNLDLSLVDGVVLSPGPGTPECPEDIGICADLLRDATLPLLGVCLGHQALGVHYGATLLPASEPWHGRTSTIRHTSDVLFSDIPQDATVGRYHSLVLASPLPRPLTCIATTEDGIVMAIRHEALPRWGVQFHPESILTPLGSRMLANFCAQISTRARRGNPHRKSNGQKGQATRQTWRSYHRRVPLTKNPEEVFRCLYGSSRVSFWLDGEARTEQRFSYMGDNSGPHCRVVRYETKTRTCRTTTSDSDEPNIEEVQGGLFAYLENELAPSCSHDELPFPFVGGFVGYFGYELKAECGGTLVHTSQFPDAHFLWADRFVAIDHEKAQLYLVALVEGDLDGPTSEWMDECERRLAKPLPVSIAPEQASLEPVRWRCRSSKEEYQEKIEACFRKLSLGESYELCLTTQFEADVRVEPLEVFSHLRETNPAPHAAYLRCNDFAVACSSPEQFLQIDTQRVVVSRPIKGTAQRGQDPRSDATERRELLTSEKDVAENVMIVDLVRNDLGRSCRIGSVVVTELAVVKTYATVHQLVSTVQGQLRDDVSVVECIRQAFPGGSMTGAPKVRTMEILETLERGPRGVYSGSIGFLSRNGAVDLNIVIRTVIIEDHRVSVGAGGAIVTLSDPEQEWREVQIKSSAPRNAVEFACRANKIAVRGA